MANTHISRLLLLALSSVFAGSCFSQKDSSTVEFVAFPVVYSTPETGFAFGGYGVLSYEADKQDTLTPPSQIQFGAVYTTESQLLFYLPFDIYTKQRLWTIRGELGFYIYSYRFYGVGEETVVDGETYELTYPRIRVDGLRKITSQLFGGVQYIFDDLNITHLDPEGLLIQGVQGAEGGVISGLGPVVEYDTRDNVYSSRYGVFATVRGSFYDRSILSDYTYRAFELDLRGFWTFGRTTVGIQGNFEANSKGTPFTRLGLVGGSKTMRGYYRGRYRDRHLWLTQLELRRPIKGRFSAAVFGGVADTYEQELDFDGLRWAGGLGLRFALIPDRRINLRVDYALGEAENSGIYFTIGEAF